MYRSMNIKSLMLAVSALVLSTSANAAPVTPTETDWLNVGDGLISYDSNTNLEWLDFSVTSNRTYDDISSKLGAGQEFEGWRYASESEIEGLWDSFGGNGPYNGNSELNNGLIDTLAPIVGIADTTFASFITAETDASSVDMHIRALISTYNGLEFGNPATGDYLNSSYGAWADSNNYSSVASALVRTSAVPVPAAVWLFGSGLIGLIGVARRKKHND